MDHLKIYSMVLLKDLKMQRIKSSLYTLLILIKVLVSSSCQRLLISNEEFASAIFEQNVEGYIANITQGEHVTRYLNNLNQPANIVDQMHADLVS